MLQYASLGKSRGVGLCKSLWKILFLNAKSSYDHEHCDGVVGLPHSRLSPARTAHNFRLNLVGLLHNMKDGKLRFIIFVTDEVTTKGAVAHYKR